MMAVLTYLKVKLANRKGQGMVEYGLIIGVIALIVVAALTVLREPLIALFTNVGNYLKTQGPPPAAPAG